MSAVRRGMRQKIVGEELIRPEGRKELILYEVLACGHRQVGCYNEDGDSCARGKGTPVTYRICGKCLVNAPKGPPGEVVQP